MKLRRPGLLDSPILNRELRVLLRSRKSFVWLALFLVVLVIAFTIAWANAETWGRGVLDRDLIARGLFTTIVVTELILFYLLAPILTSGSLAGEHERRTFDLLATTPLSGYHVALAKCFSALCYVLILIVASLPVLAITFLMGGVGLAEVIIAALWVLTTVLVSGMVGVACSSWVRRSFVALLLSLGFILGLAFVCPCAALLPLSGFVAGAGMGGGPFGSPTVLMVGATIGYCVFLSFVFLALTHLARNGYLAGSRSNPVRAKRVIKSVKVIKERQRRFPYYLIDPLKAPDPIGDGKNAVYVRDTRHHPLGRLDFVIRISYVCLFISIFIGLVLLGENYNRREFFESMLGVSHVAVVIIMFAAPLFAATAFTGEKEHGTFVPMMTTLLLPRQVLWAKLRIILRYTLFLLAALFLPAFAEIIVTPGFRARGGSMLFIQSVLWLLPFYLVLILSLSLLGLMISARCRRNSTSMTGVYLLVAFCYFGPLLLSGMVGNTRWASLGLGARALNLETLLNWCMIIMAVFAEILGPLLSPFTFLSGGEEYWISALRCWENPSLALLYYLIWALVLALMFLVTLNRLERAVTRDTVGR